MKLQIKNNSYISSGGKNHLSLSTDLKKVEAWSYGWWTFVATDSVGNVFYNNTTYSSATSGHQGKTSSTMNRLGIKVDLTLDHTKSHFGGGNNEIKACIQSEIDWNKDNIAKMKNAINKKGTHKKKNEERKELIKDTEYLIKDLRRIKNEYVGKKRIPQKRKSFKELVWNEYDNAVCEFTLKRVNEFELYFKKDNGKTQTNEYIDFLNQYDPHHDLVSLEHVKLIKELLNLKPGQSNDFILGYPHSKDIIPMIPQVDSHEYTQLTRWLKSNLKGHPMNTFALDKLHTYLVNKLNKKAYSPKEPIALPVSETLLQMESNKEVKHLRVIKTDSQLKEEGRRQSHCIGSKSYLLDCINGCQTLNYKGYTFFLSPQLEVLQTHGRHNSETPQEVISELGSLIQEQAIENEQLDAA